MKSNKLENNESILRATLINNNFAPFDEESGYPNIKVEIVFSRQVLR